MSLCVYLCVSLCVCLSVCPSVYPSASPSVCPSVSLSVSPSVSLCADTDRHRHRQTLTRNEAQNYSCTDRLVHKMFAHRCVTSKTLILHIGNAETRNIPCFGICVCAERLVQFFCCAPDLEVPNNVCTSFCVCVCVCLCLYLRVSACRFLGACLCLCLCWCLCLREHRAGDHSAHVPSDALLSAVAHVHGSMMVCPALWLMPMKMMILCFALCCWSCSA